MSVDVQNYKRYNLRRKSLDKESKDEENKRMRLTFTKKWKSFNATLENEEDRTAFYNFLCQEHSQENLDFWKICTQFKKFKNSTTISFFARAIYSEYISETAKSEVNLEPAVKEKIKEKLNAPTLDMFDEAQTEIKRLMEKDSFRRFQKKMIENKT